MSKIDVSTFMSPTSTVGMILAEKLTENNDLKTYRQISMTLMSFSDKMKILLDHQVSSKYFYKLVFLDYLKAVNEKISPPYLSYVLNVLHAKYKTFTFQIKDFNEECEEYEDIEELVD